MCGPLASVVPKDVLARVVGGFRGPASSARVRRPAALHCVVTCLKYRP
jgi:hypothetical protein